MQKGGTALKQENPNKRLIRNSAFALMYEKGYDGTSYSAIARRSGVGRPLVQRHFPAKEQFIYDLTAEAAALCRLKADGVTAKRHDASTPAESAGGNGGGGSTGSASAAPACTEGSLSGDPMDADPAMRTLHRIQLYLTLLLLDEPMRRLTAQVIANRRITERIIAFHRDSAFAAVTGADEKTRCEAALLAMGGSYELIHTCLAAGSLPDAGDMAARTLAAYFAFCADQPYGQTRSFFEQRLMDRSQARILAESVRDELLNRR